MKINYRRKQWKYRIPIGGPTLVEDSKKVYNRSKEKELKRKVASGLIGFSIYGTAPFEDGLLLDEE